MLFAWLIYINDTMDLITESRKGLFVDDLSLYIADSDQSRAVARLNGDLQRIYNCSVTNHMVFSHQKFHVINVGARQVSDCRLQQLIFGSGTPPVSRQAKLLGCMLDSKFSFRPHIDMVTERMMSVAFKLRTLAGTSSGASPLQLTVV